MLVLPVSSILLIMLSSYLIDVPVHLFIAVWDPYLEHRTAHRFHQVAYYIRCLKCIDIVESYHPDRVLRQFNRVQMILPSPLALKHATRGSSMNQY